MKRVRMIIDEQLDKVLTTPSLAHLHIEYIRHLLHKYPDTGTRINADEEREGFAWTQDDKKKQSA